MKKFILYLSIATFVFSCNSETKQETTQPESLGNTIWVNAKYLETLERTKSPLKASLLQIQ